MSNQVKNAIDMGLCGLCVTDGDVAAILRRTREETPMRSRKVNWRPALALAAVMLMLLTAVTLRLTSQGVPDLTPLDQPNANATEAPADFVPVGEKTPAINIDANQAIALAEAYIRENCDPTVDLRDAAVYNIVCEYTVQERVGNTFYANFYAVCFEALTIEDTAYTLRVKAEDGSILSCEVQRGAQAGHTAQEILNGYARVYGADRRLWTNEQLRTYCLTLKKARSGSMRWEDYLYLLSSYPETAENAMTQEEVLAATEADLDLLIYEYDRQFGSMPRWQDLERLAGLRARYISAYPNPVWKVAADQRVVNQEGYETTRTILLEIDSVTGAVKHVEAVDALYADQHESFTRSTIDALMATTTSGNSPSLEDEVRYAVAAAHVRQVWGETRDINDETLFTMQENPGEAATMQCPVQLVYRSRGEGEVTEYILYIDEYGQVKAANRSVAQEGQQSFTPTAPVLDWHVETLLEWQSKALAHGDLTDPATKVFAETVWVDDRSEKIYGNAKRAVCDELGIRTMMSFRAVMIDAEPNPVWKLAFESDKGSFLVEVDSITNELISTMQVTNPEASWYLPFVLTADLKEAGVPLNWEVQQQYLTTATDAHGTGEGMRIDHLYARFKELYGPDMGQWTQAQLRSFQQMAVLSSDYDYDLGVPCLRSTVYPDVPENAITRTQAMLAAVDAIGSSPEGWQLCGAVLIGTADDSAAQGTPVWKVCIRQPGGSFWYAEVNCMTGKVYRLHQDADGAASPGASYDYGTPQNLWFRDIVLEETIENCDAVWDCRGNG